MAADEAPAPPTPMRRPHSVCGAVGKVEAVAPLNGVPEPPKPLKPGLTFKEEPSIKTLPADLSKLPRRSSLESMSGHRSSRYGTAKTHLHYQRDTVRQYRKAMRGWHCPKKCCSGSSSTGFWVDSHQAHAVAYSGIVLNTVFLCFQAYFEDHLTQDASREMDRAVYCAVEIIFIMAFSVELALRVRAMPSLDASKWNQYDAMFLVVSFVDACILNFIPAAEPVHNVVVRLLPTLTVLRLGRFVQEFRMIIMGIFSAMRAVLWSLCLLALVIYFFAVLCASWIGRSQMYSQDDFVRGIFGSVPSSMFTLFTFATLEDFPGAVRHFADAGDAFGVTISLAIIAFILFTNLSLLNLVTAVMVDTIIDILPKKHTERIARERTETVHRLEAIFLKMDGDGDRRLTLQEFTEGVGRFDEVQNELSLLQIAALDVRELFALLDFNENGSVAVDEFIDGLLRMVPTPASKKELLGMEYDMHKMWNMLGSGQERIMASLDELHERLSSGLDRSLGERQAFVESCVQECCGKVEKQLKEHLDAAASQLLAGQKQLLEAARGADGSQALARLQRSLEALPPALAEDRQRALDGQRKSVLETLEARIPPRAADTAEFSRLSRLIEELKDSQQQLVATVERSWANGGEAQASAAASAARCSPAPSPTCQRTRPPPLQAACLASVATAASAADAGPEPEPHSVLHTPANRSVLGLPSDAFMGARTGPSFCLPSMPEARALSNSHVSQEHESLRLRSAPVPPPPTSTTQLQPPPQFQHLTMASSSRAAAEAPGFPVGLPCGRPPTSQARELQALLQATLSSQSMPAAALAAGCVPQGQGHGRVSLVQQWVRQQGWAGAPFDKLVLHLDRLGVELSETEQDALQWCLRYPVSGPAM